MKKFRYKAKDQQGKLVTGEVEATDVNLAAKLLRKRGYIIISMRTGGFMNAGIFNRLKSRVSVADLVVFTRQIATMVNAGLPVIEALSILRLQSSSSLQPIISAILADVEGGESLSTAIRKYPRVFSPTYVALIKAGEAGGVLDKVLARLADNLEKQQEFRGKVVGALIYPVIIVVGMLIVSVIMIVFVIPRLLNLYTQFDAELPFTTKILIGISSGLIQFWPVILLLAGSLTWGFILYQKTLVGKRKIAEIVFKVPIFGPLKQEIILTELTRTLALMLGAGVPILEGISVTSEVLDNVIVSEALVDVGSQIEKGFPIAYSFAKHPDAFPYIMSQMVAVGEETGKMEEVLTKVSHVFEVNSEQKVKALTAAIEPIVMIVLGIGVAFLVISVILPIYNLTTVL